MSSGGSAALNGFLYQIIHHLGWLATVSLSGKLDGDGIEDGLLILEPVGGGDARAELAGAYLVEQYKSRRQGTWSIAGIVDVLRDLRKAVPTSFPRIARYRLVTDGRPGRIGAFNAFLADVKNVANAADLDDTIVRNFGDGQQLTNRRFFDRVCEQTREAERSAEGEQVLHLLSHFELEFESSVEVANGKIDEFLRKYAADPQSAGAVRERLIGALLSYLAAGEVRLDQNSIQSLLRHVGLQLERFQNYEKLAEAMAALAGRRLDRLKYRSSQDVRVVPAWPGDKPVLLISGESGSGKTWQLGKLLGDLADRREIATLVLSGQTSAEILAAAAQDIGVVGLGETIDRSFIAILGHVREIGALSGTPHSQITIARDDVQDVDLARALVRLDWADWGSRLVMTVPEAVAEAISASDSDSVHVHRVQEFSINELDRLLAENDRQWTDLPTDLKRILRNPILTGVYLELPYTSPRSAPRSEYEIFDRFWDRAASKCRPGDMGILLALAEFVTARQRYPLPRSQWQEIDLDLDNLGRLAAAGWVKVSENGEVTYFHERLLNWAIAKSIVDRFSVGRLSREELATALANGVEDQIHLARRSLGYVPMDALWLLAEESERAEILADVVFQMEDGEVFRGSVEALYSEHIPSLGARAMPILLACLNAVEPDGRTGYRIKMIGQAVANLVCQERIDLQEDVRALLRSTSGHRQAVAIAALAAAPDAACLDRLWEIHRDRTTRLSQPNSASDISDYKASFHALIVGMARNPEWLCARIIAADARVEPVSELAFLLRSLEHPSASLIWTETAEMLMQKVPADRPRSLLACIARFADRTKLDFVISHLTNEVDFANSTALFALSIIDPHRAVTQLATVRDCDLYASRDHWLPMLLRTHPEVSRREILRLAQESTSARRTIEGLYLERPDALDPETLRFLLRMLEHDLRDKLDETMSGNPLWLARTLDVISGVTKPQLLDILAEEAGGELERLVVQVAQTRVRHNTIDRDHVRESARRFLILTGGGAIVSQILAELASEHHWVRHRGLEWAFVRNSSEIIDRLHEIALQPVGREANGRYEQSGYSEFHMAASALAAIGADECLVDVVQHQAIPELPDDLAWLRSHCGAMEKRLTNAAVETLRDGNAMEAECLTAINIAWLSDDPDFIPPVRDLLERSDPNSRIARHALIALRALGDTSEVLLQLAFAIASTASNQIWGRQALAGLGDAGLQLLAETVRVSGASMQPPRDDAVIRRLYEHPSTRSLAVEAAVSLCRSETMPNYMPFDIAAEATDAVLRERIIDKAFVGRSVFTDAVLKPIQGLAKFDVPRAIEAIEVAFRNHPKLDMQLCRELVRIAPELALEKLFAATVENDRPSLRVAAGRALRRLDPAIVSHFISDRLLALDRDLQAAIDMASWIPTPDVRAALCQLLEQKTIPEALEGVLAALDRHDQEAAVHELFGLFPVSSYERKWAILLAILASGDPYLLTDRADRLWLGRILSEPEPAIFSDHARMVVKRRREKLN